MIELYKTFYKLKRDPFRLSPDHRFQTYAHPTYKKSLAYLKFAAYREEGFVMITGAPGTGKTKIVSTTDPKKVLFSTWVSTQLDATDLLAVVAASFNIHTTSEVKSTLLLHIEKFLKFRFEEGIRVILIVDEAQGLRRDAVEELRMLSNMNVDSKPLLQIFLVGQDELKVLLRSPEMEQLRQRLIATSFIQPLTEEEVFDYVQHRLNMAGWSGDPSIEKSAIRLVYHYSRGVPRKINLICGRFLLNGCMEGKHKLTRIDMEDVVKELRNELLLLDEDAMSNEEIVNMGDELDGFLEPLVQPQKKADTEGAPEVIGGPVKANRTVQGAPENAPGDVEVSVTGPRTSHTRSAPVIRPRQASNVKPASFREPLVRPQKKTDIEEAPEVIGSPVKTHRPAKGAPENLSDDVEIPVTGPKTSRIRPAPDIKPQQESDVKPGRQIKLRAQLLLLGVALLTVLTLFVFKVMSGYSSDAIELEAYAITEEVAARVTSVGKHYIESVAKLAKDPGIAAVLMGKDSAALQAKQESLRYIFPKAINMQLLPYGIEQVDEESSPPLGYAALAQMRAAESSAESLPMEVHLYNTPQQHINIVHRIMDPAGSSVIGYIRLSLSNDVLQDLVKDLPRLNGYVEIQQVSTKGSPVTIAMHGGRGTHDDGTELVVLPINGSSWQAVYWPAANRLDYLNKSSFWALGALLLSSLAVVVLIAIVLFQRW
jgi:type II secretory pathway predicted ATPase ExeA